MHERGLPASLDELVVAAEAARTHAYAPYSRYAVGAAVRTGDGRVFAGANVENASYGLSLCAERVAVFTAVANGARAIEAVAVVTEGPEPATPCGACRQVLAEFGRDATVVMSAAGASARVSSVGELLPAAFALLPPARGK